MGQIESNPQTGRHIDDLILSQLKGLEFSKPKEGYFLIANDSTGKNSLTRSEKRNQQKKHKAITQSISTQKNIKISDLILEKTHYDTYLEGIILLPPIKARSVLFLISDGNHDVEKVALYNHPDEDQYQNNFNIGRKIQIINPFFKTALDGQTLIRIDNPNELILLECNFDYFFENLSTLVTKCNRSTSQKLFNEVKKIMDNNSQKDFTQQLKKIENIIRNGPQFQVDQSNEQKSCEKNQSIIPDQANLKAFQPHWQQLHLNTDNFFDIDDFQKEELAEMGKNVNLFFQYMTACQYCQQQPEKGIKLFQGITNNYQNFTVVYYNLAETAFEIQEYQLCVDNMKKFISIYNKKGYKESKLFTFAHYELGMSLMYLGKLIQAEEYLVLAAKQQPNNQVFLTALGMYYFKQNNLKKSEMWCSKCIQLLDTRNMNSVVESCRAYYYLFQISQNQKKIDEIIIYATKLIDLDYESYELIYGDFTNLVLNENSLNFSEKMTFLNKLSLTNRFDIMVEELLTLLTYQETKYENKVVSFSYLRQFYENTFKYDDTYLLISDDKKQIQVEVIEKTPQNIDKKKDEEEKKDDESIKQQQLVDEQVVSLVEKNSNLIEFNESQIQAIVTQLISPDQALKIEDIVQKKKSIERKDYNLIKKQQFNNKQIYKGFWCEFTFLSATFIVTVDENLSINQNDRNKFWCAAQRGFVNRKFGSQGIKQIKIKNQQIFELKINSSDKRLICDKLKEGQNSNIKVLFFDKIMTHTQLKRMIKNL